MSNFKIVNPTIGSDPEYGVIDISGEPRSVVGYLPGTKKKPFDLNEFVSCQIDNVGAECCIPPCSTEDEFVHFMTMAKDLTQKKLAEANTKLLLQSVSSQRYHENELMSKSARMFGCEPSYCVYTGGESPRPSPEEVGNLRSFGFHIHIGFKIEDGDDQFEIVKRLIRAMDINVGVPSMFIDNDSDRRQIYGNAGDFRFRRIGDVLVVEYRTLGGFMHSSEELLRFVYQQTMRAIEMFNSEKDIKNLSYDAKSVIDDGDLDMGLEICKQLNLELNNAIHSSVR